MDELTEIDRIGLMHDAPQVKMLRNPRLVVSIADEDCAAEIYSTIPKPEAARILRQIADSIDDVSSEP